MVALLSVLSPRVNRNFAAVLAAAGVGTLIFLLSIENKAKRPDSSIKWIGAAGIAIINTAFLAAASIGIDVATVLSTGTPPSP